MYAKNKKKLIEEGGAVVKGMPNPTYMKIFKKVCSTTYLLFLTAISPQIAAKIL